MFSATPSAGLVLPAQTGPPIAAAPDLAITDEAALAPCVGENLRVEPLVAEGEIVAQGQALLRLRDSPQIHLVAPMGGRVATIGLRPGRQLAQLVLFGETGSGRHEFDVAAVTDPAALRNLMQGAGIWRSIRSRPFGHMPRADERPAAIFVMAAETRPGAPDSRVALTGCEEAFARGLAAISTLCTDRTYLCEPAARPYDGQLPPRLRRIRCGRLHPQGLAGIQVHRHCPAGIDRPVWDIAAQDIADLGTLLTTGLLPETRVVSITGTALRRSRLVRCQPGADLRELCQPVLRPGRHEMLSGSAIDGRPALWLAPRDRQVTVLAQGPAAPRRHWFSAALRGAARQPPIIPTAALDQSMGGGLPAAALFRAVAAGDQETATRLGVLSLLEEDVALADYATGAAPDLATALRDLLDRIEAEERPA